jgi:hypothetical protein
MVAFRHFVVAVSACAFVAMNAGISIALDPVRSIEAFAVESNAVRLVITRRVVTAAAAAAAVDVPVATNTTPVASPIALEDLFASSLWKDGPFAVTHEEQVSNSTNMFASSLLQTASASRRLRDVMDDIKPLTPDSVDNVFAWFANTLQAPRAAFRYAIAALTSKSSVPTAFLSPEILMVLSKQCPLMPQSEPTCETDAMDDTKPSTHDSVKNVLAWFANILQAPRAAFRFVITALTPKSSGLARSEILNILSKQCPLIVTTCEVDAMDTKPLTVLQALRIVYRYAIIAYRYAITALTLGSIVYFASGVTMLASKVYLLAILFALGHHVIDDVPVATTAMLIFGISIFAATLYFFAVTVKCWFKSPIKKKELRVSNSTTAELCDDAFGYVRKVLFPFYCIMFGSWLIIFGLVGDDPLKVLTQVVGTMVVALIAKKVTEAIWYYHWLVWIHAYASTLQFLIVSPCCITVRILIVGPCCMAFALVKNAFKLILSAVLWAPTAARNVDGDDDVAEDVDDGVAGQDDVPVEAPVATVTIAAPLRRSKRVAAQRCHALCLEVAPEVAPSSCATSGPRRSARLAAKPRVNCKPYPACH